MHNIISMTTSTTAGPHYWLRKFAVFVKLFQTVVVIIFNTLYGEHSLPMSTCSMPSRDVVLPAGTRPMSVRLDMLEVRLALRRSSSNTGSRAIAMSSRRGYKHKLLQNNTFTIIVENSWTRTRTLHSSWHHIEFNRKHAHRRLRQC